MSAPKRYRSIEICELTGMSESTLRFYLRNEWLLPASEEDFDEEDLARARLIRELQEDFGVNEASVPVILHLLDQLYALRELLRKRS